MNGVKINEMKKKKKKYSHTIRFQSDEQRIKILSNSIATI